MKLITRFTDPITEILQPCVESPEQIIVLSGPAHEFMAGAVAAGSSSPVAVYDFFMLQRCMIGYKILCFDEGSPRYMGCFANRVWLSGGPCHTPGLVN